MSLIADGFKIVEEQAAKLTISENDIIEKINKAEEENDINKIDEICFARSYDIAKIVNSSKDKQKIIAFIEGGSTGAAGFAGIPFNLVLSNLIYFRSVQLIAIYYGFDVKNNGSELVIASQVFAKALSPKQDNINNELNGIIGKIENNGNDTGNSSKTNSKENMDRYGNKRRNYFIISSNACIS